MSKLDDLIRELCPDGVEYKRFDEVCTLNARIGWQRLTKAEYKSTGDYLLITGTDFTDLHEINYKSCVYVSEERYNQDPKIQLKNGDVLITKDGTLGKVVQVNGLEMPATLNGGVFVVRCKDGSLKNRFILHYLLSNHFQSVVEQQKTGSTISHLTQALFSRLMIPIPPLEIQCEIVRILDNFTNLTAELTAELTARKAQYSYYRDKLLQCETTIEKLEIGEVCNLSAGGDVPKDRFSKEKTEQYKIPIISNGSGINALYGYTDVPKIVEPSVTVAARGTIGYAEYRDYPYFPIIRLITLMPKDMKQLNAKYLYYCLQGRKYKVPMSGIPQLTVPMLKKEKISIPPIEIQNRIVEVLDNFEKICSDLNIGLPAEIEARQKQYEYYRDKLLTFAEAGGTIVTQNLIKLLQYVYGVVWLELNDVIVSLNTGLNPRKFFKLNTDDATNYYITIREMKDGKIVPSEKTDRMNNEALKLCNNRSNLEIGDVLFSGTGTIGETAVVESTPTNWNIKEGVYAIKPNQRMIRPLYLRYVLMTDFIKKEYMKKAAGGTVQSVPMGELRKIEIPVPMLPEQDKIIGVLKTLDELCGDLTSGLPAEIEARQKQYEYYRDKLLQFGMHHS